MVLLHTECIRLLPRELAEKTGACECINVGLDIFHVRLCLTKGAVSGTETPSASELGVLMPVATWRTVAQGRTDENEV